MISIQGKGVSTGVAAGPLYFYQRAKGTLERYQVADRDAEFARFKEAQAKAIEQLGVLAEKAREEAGDEAAMLFETHQMMIGDEDYEAAVERMIREEKIPVELHQAGDEENRGKNGARVCDFSFFRTFYESAEYLIVQCGLEVYNILFTVEGAKGKELSHRTVGRVMDALMQQMKEELKRGSALTQCSSNQLLVMMGADGYEVACLRGEEQVKKFYQNNPNPSIRLSYGVWRVGGEPEEK